MEASGFIDLQGNGDVELVLALASPYENPRALQRIRCVLAVDERWRIVEDLAADAKPIQIRIFAKAPARIPVRLGVHADRTCFFSRAWPRASRVQLHLRTMLPSEHGCTLQLVASRGLTIEPTSPSRKPSEAVA